MTIYSLDVLHSYLEQVCCSMCSSNCCFLTCIQVSQEAGQVVFSVLFLHVRAFHVVQLVKNPPAMWETWVRCLGWEDPLEKEMATHSSILAWRIPQTEEPDRLQFMGSQELDTT